MENYTVEEVSNNMIPEALPLITKISAQCKAEGNLYQLRK